MISRERRRTLVRLALAAAWIPGCGGSGGGGNSSPSGTQQPGGPARSRKRHQHPLRPVAIQRYFVPGHGVPARRCAIGHASARHLFLRRGNDVQHAAGRGAGVQVPRDAGRPRQSHAHATPGGPAGTRRRPLLLLHSRPARAAHRVDLSRRSHAAHPLGPFFGRALRGLRALQGIAGEPPLPRIHQRRRLLPGSSPTWSRKARARCSRPTRPAGFR